MKLTQIETGNTYNIHFKKQKGNEKRPCPICCPDRKSNPPLSFNHEELVGFCHKCEARFKAVNADDKQQDPWRDKPHHLPEPSYISFDIVSQSLQTDKPFEHRIKTNSFLQFLANQFGIEAAKRLADYWIIGTSKQFGGSPVFWQIDHNHRPRSGKIMAYNSETGKRAGKTTWVHNVHKAIHQGSFRLNQCLFGAHLIPDSAGPFGIVESEKTAVIASYFMPELTWLASGGKQNLKAEKLAPIKDKPILVFPDVDAQSVWEQLIKHLRGNFYIEVSRFLYDRTTEDEKQEGLDLADWLLRHEHQAESPELPDVSRFQQKANGYREPITAKDRKKVFKYLASKHPQLNEITKTFNLKY